MRQGFLERAIYLAERGSKVKGSLRHCAYTQDGIAIHYLDDMGRHVQVWDGRNRVLSATERQRRLEVDEYIPGSWESRVEEWYTVMHKIAGDGGKVW